MSRFSLVLSVPLALGLCAVLAAQPGPTGAKPYLGVALTQATDNGGVKIEEVTPDSPAATAGLKPGDVILKLNGKDVMDVIDFLREVGAKKPGTKLELRVHRGEKDQTVNVTLGQRPSSAIAPPPLPMETPNLLRPAFLGVQVEPLTADVRKQLKAKAEAGAVVTEVVPNSPASQAGLQRDDIITAFNGQAVKDPADLRHAVQKAGAGKEVILRVQHAGEQKDVRVALKGGAGISGISPWSPDGKMLPLDIESLWDHANTVRSLQHRVDMLEQRLNALEKQQAGSKK